MASIDMTYEEFWPLFEAARRKYGRDCSQCGHFIAPMAVGGCRVTDCPLQVEAK